MPGRYLARPQVEFMDHDRNVQLITDLGFLDGQDLLWDVPAGAVVDGASIPRVFWSIIGGPFEGKYRDASIIHDWFCDTRQRSWQATHRVFYDAMLVSQVSNHLAKVMYLAVRWGGPRWDTRVETNIKLMQQINYLEALRDHLRDQVTGRNLNITGDGIAGDGTRAYLAQAIGEFDNSDEILRAANLDLESFVYILAGGGHIPMPARIVNVALPTPAQSAGRPAQLEDFAHIFQRIQKDDISLEEIDYLADHLTLMVDSE